MKVSPDREQLLRLARADGPRPEQVAAIGDRLSASIASGAPAPVLGGLGTSAKLWIGLGVAVTLGATALLARRDDVEPSPSVTPPAVVDPAPAPRLEPPPPPPSPPAPAAATPGDAEDAKAEPEPAARSPRTARARPHDEPSASVPSLEQEAILLREAATALRAQDLDGAREHLRTHERRFPDGALTHERRVLRIKLLCLEGATDQAVAQARAMLAEGLPARARRQLRSSCARVAFEP